MQITNKLELIVEAAQAPPMHAVLVTKAAHLPRNSGVLEGYYHPRCAMGADCVLDTLVGVPLWVITLVELPEPGTTCLHCGLSILT